MATIEEIAKAAGVSIATVSRALNNQGGVSPSTRDHVLEISKNLGREPLSATEKKILLVTFPTAEELTPEIIRSAKQHDMSVFVKVILTYDFLYNDMDLINSFDGIIISDYIMSEKEKQLVDHKLPIVYCRENGYVNNGILIAPDDFKMGYDLTSHLISQGKKHIVYCLDETELTTMRHPPRRFNGYRAAMIDNGIYDETLVKFATTIMTDSDELRELSASLISGKPDAVILNSSFHVRPFVEFLNSKGIKYPEDISVATYDDSEIFEVMGITTVKFPFEELAKQAVFLLSSMFEGTLALDTKLVVEIEHSLNIRSSTS